MRFMALEGSHRTAIVSSHLPIQLKYTQFTVLESALIAYLLESSDKALLIGHYAVGCTDLLVRCERDQGWTVAGSKETMVSVSNCVQLVVITS